MKVKLLVVFIVVIIFTPSALRAGGTGFSTFFGARTLSLNGLYIAGIDGINNIWANPAGLAFLTGSEINISVLDRMEQQEFDSPTGGLRRSFRNDNFTLGGGLYYNLRPGLTTGLAYSKLIDYNVDWPFAFFRRSDSLTAIAAYDFRNSLNVSTISPSIAFAFGNISLGLAVDAYYITQNSVFPVSNTRWTSGQGLVAYQFNYEQNAWAFGINLGLMVNFSDNLRLGLKARSGTKASLKGNASSQMFAQLDAAPSTVDISSDFKLPWVFGIGAVYKLSENFSFNIDGTYSLWKNINSNYIFNFSNSVWQQSLSVIDSLTGFQGNNFQFIGKNSIDAGVGLEYGSQLEGFSYRLSYKYSQNPVTNSSFSLLFPGVDQHWFSIGLGYKGEGFYLDAGLAYVLGISKEIIRPGFPNLSGTYSTSNIVPAVTLHFEL